MLVVEDDPVNRQMYVRALQSAGHSVDAAGNGSDALKMLRATVYDAVVSDVMMPAMDGFELVRAIRSGATTALTPVVLLTALVGDRHRVRGFELGADVYLTKPVRFDALVKEVEAAIARGRAMRADAAAAATLAGKLDAIGPVVVLTLLASMAKSGVIELKRAASSGRIYIRDGTPIAADFGELRGLEAACQLLQWNAGEFRFRETKVTEPDELQRSLDALLMEVARRS